MKPTTTLAGLGAAAVLLTGGIALAVDANDSDDLAEAANAALAQQTTSQTTPLTTTETTSDTTSPTSSPTSSPTTSRTDPTNAAPAGTPISPREAAAIAVRHVGGGTVTEIEREFEHGRLEWKVEVVHNGQEVDVRVDSRTGKITRVDRDDRDDRGRDDRDDVRYDDRDDDGSSGHGSDDRYDDNDSSGHGSGGDDNDDDNDDDDNSGHGSDDS